MELLALELEVHFPTYYLARDPCFSVGGPRQVLDRRRTQFAINSVAEARLESMRSSIEAAANRSKRRGEIPKRT